MVLALGPRLNYFFPPCYEAVRDTWYWNWYEAGGIIYLILLWVPTRMVLCHLGHSTTSLVGSMIPVLILVASLYFNPTLDCTNFQKKFSSFPKGSPQWEQELNISTCDWNTGRLNMWSWNSCKRCYSYRNSMFTCGRNSVQLGYHQKEECSTHWLLIPTTGKLFVQIVVTWALLAH